MKSFFVISILLILIICNLDSIDACTAIAITGKASESGSPMLGHTDDAGGSASDVRLVPISRKHIKLCNLAGGELEAREIPQRPVYHWGTGYPRLVSDDRGQHYAPTNEYNDKPRMQKVFEPLGFIPDVSPAEILLNSGSDHVSEKDVKFLGIEVESLKTRTRKTSFRYGYFDHDYGLMNEMQLSVVESTCGAKTVGWSSDLPYGRSMFGIAELSKVALERCITAKCAVKIMGELAENHGFYSEDSGDPAAPDYGDSAEALIIGDRFDNVWVFHVLTGENNASAIWAAQRVPDGHITAVANGFTIREIDFDDTDNFLVSTNIRDVANRLGFWNEKQDKQFDFAKVFGYEGTTPLLPLYVGRRIWRIFDTFAPGLKLDSTLGENADHPTYPFSVKPEAKITLKQLTNVMKDHYEGTPYDMTKGIAAGPFGNPNRFSVGSKMSKVPGGWERPISIWRALFSFVCEINTKFSSKPRGVLWYGPDKPHGTVFFPFWADEVFAEKEFLQGMQSEFDFTSAWRAFNFVNNWAMLRYDMISAELRSHQAQWQEIFEEALLKNIPMSETRLNGIQYWWKLAWRIIPLFSDGYLTTGEGETEMKSLGYPEWWLNATDYMEWPGKSYNPPKVVESTKETSFIQILA